jgi:hypothetical protein
MTAAHAAIIRTIAEDAPAGGVVDVLPAGSTSTIDILTREQLVEWILAVALVVVGCSLLLRSRAWIGAFTSAAAHPLAPFLTGLYALLSGLFIVTLHNLWVRDVRVLVTLVGWIALVAGVLLLLAPEAYRALLRRVPITPQLVALRGLIRVAIGGAVVGYLIAQG